VRCAVLLRSRSNAARVAWKTPEPERAQLRERHHRVLLAGQRADPPIDVL
jgi:hypothetical protein